MRKNLTYHLFLMFLVSFNLIAEQTIQSEHPTQVLSAQEIQLLLDQPDLNYVYLDSRIRANLMELADICKDYSWSKEFKQILDDVKSNQSIALYSPMSNVIDECLKVVEQIVAIEQQSIELQNLKTSIELYKQEMANGNAIIKAEEKTRSSRRDVDVFCDLLVKNCLRVNGNVVICGTLSPRIISCPQRIEVQDGSAVNPSYTFCNDLDTGIYRAERNRLSISTGGIERVTVTSVGNLGVGTSSPSEQLEITRNFELPDTNSSGTAGIILKDGTRFIHNFGTNSTYVGKNAGNLTTTGNDNTGIGVNALSANTSGNRNAAIGEVALRRNTAGNRNTGLGDAALVDNTTGDDNTAVGFRAGENITGGNNNIYLGTEVGSGLVPIANESNAIRIGVFNAVVPTGKQPNACFIQGINGALVDQNVAVVIGSNGKLGTAVASSRDYKKDIEEIGDFSNNVSQLRPVKFRYKDHINPTGDMQYGLISEEVAEVYPDLVNYKENRPESIKYSALNILLLNEVKKLMHEVNKLKLKLENH